VDFDTGSSDLFVPSISCTQNCANHKLFDPTTSSTAVDLGRTFSLSYGDGSSVSGEQYNETVYLANLPAVSQAIGVADAYSTGFATPRFPADGLLGMGFQSISDYQAPPVFQSLYAQGQLDQPVFAFKLATTGSELSIGAINHALHTGAITYTPVTQAVSRVHLT
jgi:cathepsin D